MAAGLALCPCARPRCVGASLLSLPLFPLPLPGRPGPLRPAIWINNISTTNSLIFGTDKKSGVYTYDLNANKIGYTKLGNINNIDLRSVNLDDFGSYTFIFASNRTTSTLDLWIYEDEAMDALAKSKKFNIENNPSFKGSTNMIVYGVCAGYDQEFGVIAFITEDEGSRVQMWSYNENGLSLLKTFNNANAAQSEGCVYDDENRTLLISEEQDRGILRAYKINTNLDFSKAIEPFSTIYFSISSAISNVQVDDLSKY